MSEKITAFIINEGKSVEVEPEIVEAKSSICRFKVDVLQEGDAINRNSRNYPWELLVEGCKDATLQERLSTGTLYCEIGHPHEKSVPRQLEILRDNSACIIKSLFFNKPYIGGILETMATQKGRDLAGLITENHCKIAFSMRGLGRVVEKSGYYLVQKPFKLVTWDEVVQPSVAKAYLSQVLSESVENKVQEDVFDEKLIALSEASLKQYLVDSDKNIKSLCEQMHIEPTKDNVIVNEDGTLTIFDNDNTLIVNSSKFIRDEVHSYLRGLGKHV